MNSEKRTITRGLIPYDGREGMFLRLSKRVKSLANSEDESEDDLKSLGISHLKGIPSSLKIHRSELHLKEGEFRITCLRKAVLTGESLENSYVAS